MLCLDKSVSLTSLVKKLKANRGYLEVALHMLESLGWVSKNARGAYRLTSKAKPDDIPDGLAELYRAPIETLLFQENQQKLLTRWIQDLIQQQPPSRSPAFRLLEGAVWLPLLIAIRQEALHQKIPLFSSVPDPLREVIADLFIHQGWARESNGEEKDLALTELGGQLIERATVMAIAASYRPMLARNRRRSPELSHLSSRRVSH